MRSAHAAIEERRAEIAALAVELTQGRLRIDDLERVASRLSERVVSRERELRELKAELEKLRESGADGARAFASLAAEIEQIRGQARGQATRIRMQALRGVLADGAGEDEPDAEIDTEQPSESAQDAGAIEVANANGNGHHHVDDPASMFEGLVEVEIGPLEDFAQLVGFEDAASGIGATSEISVKRFAKGRATLEVSLSEPVELLRELEERAPFDFQVRDTRSDRLILDLDGE